MKVMLYTDGLIEAPNAAGEELGAARILSQLRERPPADIRSMLEQVLATMRDFTHTEEQDDDLCLLGVQYSES